MKNSSVLCFGELLIDMISTNSGNLSDSDGFLKNFGGAPANTALGLAKLGVNVNFLGKVGKDPFGVFLREVLDKAGVKSDLLINSEDDNTTLAFVSLTDKGERDFIFYSGAHDNIAPSEVDLPKDTNIFHFGSLTQINSKALAATEKLINQARKLGAIVSYDPNIREALWVDLKKARKIVLETLKKVDILKVNESEAELLSGSKDLKKASEILFTKNLDALFITMGSEGCLYKTKNYQGTIPTIKVKVVDTTGAGDAFNAGFIYSLCKSGKRFSQMNKEEMERNLRFANIIATLTTTKKGAIRAFPDVGDLKRYSK